MAEANQPLGTDYLLVVEPAMGEEERGMAVYRITLRPEAREEDFEAAMEPILRTAAQWSSHIGERLTMRLIKEEGGEPASASGFDALHRFEADMSGRHDFDRTGPEQTFTSSMSGSIFREVFSYRP